MFFLERFKQYASKSGYIQDDIDMMINNLKILNKLTWSEDLTEDRIYYININFENIENIIVNTFFYDYDGGDIKEFEKSKLTIKIKDDDNYNTHEYKYKKDDDGKITKLFIVDRFLKNIKEIFKNANIKQGGRIFTNPSDRIIGKIFQEIDNKLFKENGPNFLEHLKFEFLEPVNKNDSDATEYMKNELEKGADYEYYFHTKFFMTLITIFIEEINKSNGNGNFVQSLSDNEKEEEEKNEKKGKDQFEDLRANVQNYRERKERVKQEERDRQEQMQKEVEKLRIDKENAEAEKKELEQNAQADLARAEAEKKQLKKDVQAALARADAEQAERQRTEVMLNGEKEKVRLMGDANAKRDAEKLAKAKQQEEEKTIQTDLDDDFSETDIVVDTDEEGESVPTSSPDSRSGTRSEIIPKKIVSKSTLSAPIQNSTNIVNGNKVSNVSSFGNEDSLEILKRCLDESLKNIKEKSNPLKLSPSEVMMRIIGSPKLILYPFLNDVKIDTPEKLLITKDDSYNIEIASEKLDEIIDKIYNYFKTKCFNIKSELSRSQKILIVCEFILVVIEYIKTKLNSKSLIYISNKDNKIKVANSIKFYENLYKVFYKEILKEFLNSNIPDNIEKAKLEDNIFYYYYDYRKLSIEKLRNFYDDYEKGSNKKKKSKILKCIKCSITRILNLILKEGLTYKPNYIEDNPNLIPELKKIITDKILENIKKTFGSDGDDNIYGKISKIFEIYFEDSQIVDDARCNIIETDPECEPAGDADEEAEIFNILDNCFKDEFIKDVWKWDGDKTIKKMLELNNQNKILYPFLTDSINVNDLSILDENYVDKIKSNELNDIISKIYKFCKNCTSSTESEIYKKASQYQKTCIAYKFISIVTKFIKDNESTEQNQDIKGKLSQIIKFYDKLYNRIYNLSAEEFLKEFLNSLEKEHGISNISKDNIYYPYYAGSEPLISIDKCIKINNNLIRNRKPNSTAKSSITKILKDILDRCFSGSSLLKNLINKKSYNNELHKIIACKVLNNVEKYLTGSLDIIKNIFKFYFKDKDGFIAENCNNEVAVARARATSATATSATSAAVGDEEAPPPSTPPPSTPPPTPRTSTANKKLLNFIFQYDNEKEIKKRIKFLQAKYKLELSDEKLNLIASNSDFAKGILDTKQQKTSSNESDITTRDVNTFIDFLANYKFSYNHIDMDGDIKKLIKLYNKVGIIIDEETAKIMLNEYFPKGQLEKSKLEYLYNLNYVKPSNESENLRAFNIFLKSLEKKNINDVINDVYEVDPDDKIKNVFKELFSDSNGKFKISSISKLF